MRWLSLPSFCSQVGRFPFRHDVIVVYVQENYSTMAFSEIGVDRKHALKWLISQRSLHGQVFVRGVEVKTTLYALKKSICIPKML
jgi:hypothetical protein